MSSVEKQIKETKKNSLYIEVPLFGDGTPDNPYDPFGALRGLGVYTHLDSLTADGHSDIDYENRKARIYINKLRSDKKAIGEIRRKFKVFKETR